MNELSLFSGAGGGLLATKHLLGWRTTGYVETNDYCQRVIAQRIKDGFLDEAPIFGDIRAFIRQGFAESYKGMVDVVTAGFPCQPFSAAGRRNGKGDERNLWPVTLECLRLIAPRFALLENVPRLLQGANPYGPVILRDLAESGFHCRWVCLPAYVVGAPQVGERLWILVSTDREGLEGIHEARRGESVQPIEGTIPGEFWETVPRVHQPGHGLADRVERTKALGNGQVPAVAAAAWEVLTKDSDPA